MADLAAWAHKPPQQRRQETYCFPGTLLAQVTYPLPAAAAGSDDGPAARALEVRLRTR